MHTCTKLGTLKKNALKLSIFYDPFFQKFFGIINFSHSLSDAPAIKKAFLKEGLL